MNTMMTRNREVYKKSTGVRDFEEHYNSEEDISIERLNTLSTDQKSHFLRLRYFSFQRYSTFLDSFNRYVWKD